MYDEPKGEGMKIRKKDGSWKEIIYNEKQLYQYALNRLGEREFSRAELLTKMKRLQPDESMIHPILDKMEALNYLSDARRARNILLQYQHKEGLSKLKQRLATKGINKQTIEQVLEEENIGAADDELQKAKSLLIKKFKTYDKENNNKMYRFLVSRGYNGQIISKALKEFSSGNLEIDY